MNKEKLLTPLELKVMNILWNINKGFVKDVLEHWEEAPKPAYNTISTIIRILQTKGFIDHNVYGRTHEYYPAISKEVYQETFLSNAIENVFAGSLSSLVSTLVDKEAISQNELDVLKALIDKS